MHTPGVVVIFSEKEKGLSGLKSSKCQQSSPSLSTKGHFFNNFPTMFYLVFTQG